MATVRPGSQPAPSSADVITITVPGTGTTATSQETLVTPLPTPGNVVQISMPGSSDTTTNYGALLPPIAYHHSQGTSSDTWEITHNLGFFPNVTTMDSANPPSVVEGEIYYIDSNSLRVTFSAPFSGNAYLS